MSTKIKNNFDAIRLLQKANPKLRRAILDNSRKELVLALCDIIANVLSGTVELTELQRSRLKRHTGALRFLAKKNVSVNRKKEVLKQKGGFLATLLPPAIALLATIIDHAAR